MALSIALGALAIAAAPSPAGELLSLAQDGPAPTPPIGKELMTSHCGGARICVFDSFGALLSWSEQHEVAAPARRNFWGNRTNPFREKRTFTGGYPAIKERQEAYNSRLGSRSWERIPLGRSRLDSTLDSLLVQTAGRISPDGTLNLRTLSIPYLEARRAVNRLWGRYQSDCLRDAAGDSRAAEACLGEIETRRNLVEAGKFPFVDAVYALRAKKVFVAWDACLAIRDTVEELVPLTRRGEEESESGLPGPGNWPENIGVDHLEPDSLPGGFLPRLDARTAAAKAAIMDAALFEDGP